MKKALAGVLTTLSFITFAHGFNLFEFLNDNILGIGDKIDNALHAVWGEAGIQSGNYSQSGSSYNNYINNNLNNSYFNHSASYSMILNNNKLDIQVKSDKSELDSIASKLKDYCKKNNLTLESLPISGGMEYKIQGNNLSQRLNELTSIVYGDNYSGKTYIDNFDSGWDEEDEDWDFSGSDPLDGIKKFENHLNKELNKDFSPIPNSTGIDDFQDEQETPGIKA